MNLKYSFEQLELSFWHLMIPIMSESRFLRKTVPVMYSFVTHKDINKIAFQALIWAISGLVIGFLYGYLEKFIH